MKIVRFIEKNQEFYGVLKSGIINKISGSIFNKYVITKEQTKLDLVKLVNPVDPPNILAIGLNYKQHAVESGFKFPEKPVLFLKSTSSVIGTNSYIKLPNMAPNKVDYEAELAIIIGRKAKDLEPAETDNYILGYTCANDVSARDCQLKIDKQWARGKSFDTFCPIGPWIETDLDPNNCKISLRLNNEIMQQSSTSDMIFNCREIVSYLSKNMTLLPGTLILTGTPQGVGFARNPAVYLKAGDTIEIEIENIGILTNSIKN